MRFIGVTDIRNGVNRQKKSIPGITILKEREIFYFNVIIFNLRN